VTIPSAEVLAARGTKKEKHRQVSTIAIKRTRSTLTLKVLKREKEKEGRNESRKQSPETREGKEGRNDSRYRICEKRPENEQVS
jgi:hypothetical protein